MNLSNIRVVLGVWCISYGFFGCKLIGIGLSLKVVGFLKSIGILYEI